MFYLKRNLPTSERAIRIALALGIVIGAFALGLTGWLQLTAIASAAMLAATALVGFCPACWLVGRKPLGATP